MYLTGYYFVPHLNGLFICVYNFFHFPRFSAFFRGISSGRFKSLVWIYESRRKLSIPCPTSHSGWGKKSVKVDAHFTIAWCQAAVRDAFSTLLCSSGLTHSLGRNYAQTKNLSSNWDRNRKLFCCSERFRISFFSWMPINVTSVTWVDEFFP